MLFVRDDVIRVVDVALVSASFSRVLLRANSKLLMALGNSGGGSFTVKGLHINKLVLLEAEPSVVQRLAPKRAEIGQIYIPFVNWTLAAATLAAVIGFGSSDALAGAYGIAVSLLMAITTLMATFVALHWKHNPILVYGVNGSLLALDLLFFASTSTKIFEGGWFPLLIALVIAFLMLTWRKGEEMMDAIRLEVREPTKKFVEHLNSNPPLRVPGTAVVLGRMAKGVPLALSPTSDVTTSCTKMCCSSP